MPFWPLSYRDKLQIKSMRHAVVCCFKAHTSNLTWRPPSFSVLNFVAEGSILSFLGPCILINISFKLSKFLLCFLRDAASVLAKEIVLYRSSICLRIPANLQIDFSELSFAAWSTFFFYFLCSKREKQIISQTQTHTHTDIHRQTYTDRLFYFFVITQSALLVMEISSSLRRGGGSSSHIIPPGHAEGSTAKDSVFKKAERLYFPLS